MTDLDVATLIIKSAKTAAGHCQHCAKGVLDEAIRLQPELPWLIAAHGLHTEYGTYEFAITSQPAAA